MDLPKYHTHLIKLILKITVLFCITSISSISYAEVAENGPVSEISDSSKILVDLANNNLPNLLNEGKSRGYRARSFEVGDTIYRGNTDPKQSLYSLVRLLLGDRKSELRSWDYQRLLNKKLDSGLSYQQALVETDLDIANKIAAELGSKSAWDYVRAQVTGTVVKTDPSQMKQKTGSSIPTATFGDGWGKFHAGLYAGIQTQAATAVNSASIPTVLEIDPSKVAGLPMRGEFFIFSHIPYSAIRGLFARIPQEGDRPVKWIYLLADSSRKFVSVHSSSDKMEIGNEIGRLYGTEVKVPHFLQEYGVDDRSRRALSSLIVPTLWGPVACRKVHN